MQSHSEGHPLIGNVYRTYDDAVAALHAVALELYCMQQTPDAAEEL